MPYAEDLSAAWVAAQAPRLPGAPTVVSTFAGGGGSSLGYKMAGYDVRVAVEWMAYPASCYRLNSPMVSLIEGDIAQVSVADVLQAGKLQVGQLDVLDGSPPCQGFSQSGKRVLMDPRNSLFKEFIRLLRGVKPRVFVMENVAGMIRGKMLWVFRQILQELKGAGYAVECRLMNAQWFGVPQSRSRVIFVGVRDDLNVSPSHPEHQQKRLSIADACPWLSHAPIGYAKVEDDLGGIFTRPARGRVGFSGPSPSIMKLGIGGAGRHQFLVNSGHIAEYPAPSFGGKAHAIAALTLAGKSGFDVTGAGWYSQRKLALDKPSSTITKTGQFNGAPITLAPIGVRGLSIGEVKRLCSFPDEYKFVDLENDRKTWEEAWGVLGNAVPPLFMRAIAKHIRVAILQK